MPLLKSPPMTGSISVLSLTELSTTVSATTVETLTAEAVAIPVSRNRRPNLILRAIIMCSLADRSGRCNKCRRSTHRWHENGPFGHFMLAGIQEADAGQ